jgi:hypothetical protein
MLSPPGSYEAGEAEVFWYSDGHICSEEANRWRRVVQVRVLSHLQMLVAERK